MRRILNVTNEEEPGTRAPSSSALITNIRGCFDPSVLDGYERHFDSVIFSVPTPRLNEVQLDAIDRALILKEETHAAAD